MGRLDDNAKHRIVVLRKAGLSFRKIKKVLELDNIKVTPQAIYLYLKRKKIEPEKSASACQSPTAKGQSWGQVQLWNLLQEKGGQNKESGPQGPKDCEATSNVAQQDKETEIKIVSVTSLSKVNPSLSPPSSSSRSIAQGQTSPETRPSLVRPAQHATVNGPRPIPPQPICFNGRARTPLPAIRNPALLVTKKIVDRAINLQKKVTSQNGFQMLNHGGPCPLPPSITNHQAMRPAAPPVLQVKDASTQTTPSSIPASNVPSFPAPKANISTEHLDSIRGEIHRLTQVMQSLIERQNRWEQEQLRQRQFLHQEVLSQIQELGATLEAKITQSSASFTSAQELEVPLPDLGHFKMEL